MAAYGIMRVEKRTRNAVFGLEIEANRTQLDHERGRDFARSDIDWDKTAENVHLVRTENWNKEITRQLKGAGVKERKGSIVLLDAVYTASAEWFEAHAGREQQLDFFRQCLAFHRNEFGDRVINAIVHFDETTPHMQVASIPIVEDEKGQHLSAKIIMGGRDDYRKRQDRFYEEVSKLYGMERGEVRAPEEVKAHTTKREWQLAAGEELIEETTRQAAAARQRLLEEQIAVENMERKRERLEREAEEAEQRIREAGDTAERYERTLQAVREANDRGEDFVSGFGKTLTGKATLSEEQVEKVKELQAAVYWQERQHENAAEEISRRDDMILRLKQSLDHARELLMERTQQEQETERKAHLWDKLLAFLDCLRDDPAKRLITEVIRKIDPPEQDRSHGLSR